MICDRCKKNVATFHKITEINGLKNEIHLCSECSKDEIVPQFNMFNVGQVFDDFFEDNLIDAPKRKNVCPECNTSLDEFLNSSFVGCENCYKTFQSYLDEYNKINQFGRHHQGKLPNVFKKVSSKEDELRKLNEELSFAVQEERFEDAILIKNKINALKEKDYE